MKTKLKTIIKILISIILIFLLLSKINIKKIIVIAKNINPITHLILFLIIILANIIHSFRWKLLLKPFEYKGGIIKLFKLKLISIYYNCILPSNLSGDFMRSYYLSKDQNIKLSKPLSSIILERLLGLCALMLFIFVGIFLNYEILKKINIFPYLLILTCLFLISMTILFSTKIKNIIKAWFLKSKFRKNKSSTFLRDTKPHRKVLGKIINLIKEYYLAIHYYIKFKKTIIISFFLAIILQGSFIMINYLIFHSIGIKIDIWKLFLIIPIISILNMIPVSFGNIGFREGIYVLSFSHLSIKPEQALIVSLLIRFYNIIFGLIGVLFISSNFKTKLKK